MDNLLISLQPYIEFAPHFFIALATTFLLTPVVGFLVKWLKVQDLPAKLRKVTDKTRKTRIRKAVVPRAGGLAVILPFLIIILLALPISKQLSAIVIGVLILTIIGFLDDKYQLDSRLQFVFQVLAALIVVAAGISIDRIQGLSGASFSLRTWIFPFTIGGSIYSLALPADVITILWILILINAVNWIFGVDGLGEGVSTIAFITIVFISIKMQNPETALIAATLAGGILGFLPYNLHPSKIFSGTTGTTVYGFMIAVLSILGGTKVSTAVIVLLIPIIDMIWVMVGRINRKQVTKLKDVFKATSEGDDTHLHHRLLRLGLSVKQVATIECIAVGICAVFAFIAADLPKVTIIAVVGVLVLITFLIISMLLKNGVKVGQKQVVEKKEDKEKKEPKEPGETPESRFAY